MRAGIHPINHRVVYVDTSTGEEWIGHTTIVDAKESKTINGVEHPVVRLDISAKSHPFWTGHARTLDTEGRIDRFKRRYAQAQKAAPSTAEKSSAAKKASEKAKPKTAKKATKKS